MSADTKYAFPRWVLPDKAKKFYEGWSDEDLEEEVRRRTAFCRILASVNVPNEVYDFPTPLTNKYLIGSAWLWNTDDHKCVAVLTGEERDELEEVASEYTQHTRNYPLFFRPSVAEILLPFDPEYFPPTQSGEKEYFVTCIPTTYHAPSLVKTVFGDDVPDGWETVQPATCRLLRTPATKAE